LGEKATSSKAKIKAFLTKPVREVQLAGALLRIFENKGKSGRVCNRLILFI
jgi:hypothetical protein